MLKPGGRLCLLEITSPRGAVARLLLKGYMRGVVPILARFVARHRSAPELMRYYWDTIEACAPPAQVVATLTASGFADAKRQPGGRGLSILSEYQAVKPA